MKKKILVSVAGVACAILVAGTAVLINFSTKTMDRLDEVKAVCAELQTKVADTEEMNAKLLELAQTEEEENQEVEFVSIDGQYEIRDTKKISDAYISGNTDDLDEIEKETLKMATDVINEVTKPEMTVYEKEVAIYTWLKTNVGFDSSSLLAVANPNINCFTPYGVLKGRSAVCVGYATTFKLFMNMLGLDCMVEHDTSLSHSWDLVKLDDGEWYLVDLVYDSGSGKPAFNTFNCTNAVFATSHDWNQELYPIANGTKYNYASQNAEDCKDIKELPKKVKALVDTNKSGAIYIRLTQDDIDTTYLAVMMQGIEERCNNNIPEGYLDTQLSVDGNGKYIAVFTLSMYSEDEPSTDKSSEAAYEGLTELLDELFGQSYQYDDYEYDYTDVVKG